MEKYNLCPHCGVDLRFYEGVSFGKEHLLKEAKLAEEQLEQQASAHPEVNDEGEGVENV